MSNREKWQEKLRGASHYEAFRIIWGKKNLTPEQRKALFKFWEEIQDEKQKEIVDK